MIRMFSIIVIILNALSLIGCCANIFKPNKNKRDEAISRILTALLLVSAILELLII